MGGGLVYTYAPEECSARLPVVLSRVNTSTHCIYCILISFVTVGGGGWAQCISKGVAMVYTGVGEGEQGSTCSMSATALSQYYL